MRSHLGVGLLALTALATAALPQGYPPDRAAAKMTAPDGFAVKLVAAEPLVRQPVAIDFDDRSRLWVMQYLQYPNPAGLKRVKVDRYSRTVYDKMPEPPPKGPKGEDRLTILLDPDENGRFRKSKDFLKGLNLASGFAFGHGGVFVLNPPYLLFYPDRDRDDVTDSDPDVLLTGFGIEDAHSVANSLTWGPDGWLYGCQGSTVTANIRGVEFQQGVWRYHPLTRDFELFCEGGGNSWGLDFDRHGHLLYCTNHGGFVMLHGVQGGYYWKSFGKHGALHNPHAYGYFDHVPHADFTGGHVSVGGIVYRGDAYPERFRHTYIAADLLGHAVYWHDVEPAGSSFRSRHGGELLRANDTWFAPCDVCLGPDGCVYVADWHDKRTAHPDPDAEWDRANGRVYRVEYKGYKPPGLFDVAKLDRNELMKLLTHRDDWFASRARRVLADRRDPEVIFPLRTVVREGKGEDQVLQALWALHVSGGFTEAFGRELLGHKNEHVRRWAVRLLGDEKRVEPETAKRLAKSAADDPSAFVRSQLASTAKRLPARDALPILKQLMVRDLDDKDPHIPLLLWWAVEHHALEATRELTSFLTTPEARKVSLIRAVILPRLVRRYVAEGTDIADLACRDLFAGTDRDLLPLLVPAVEQGMAQRPPRQRGQLEPKLIAALRELAGQPKAHPSLVRILVRTGDAVAVRDAIRLASDSGTPVADRVSLMETLSESGEAKSPETFARFLDAKEPEAIQRAAVGGLARCESSKVPDHLLAAYAKLSDRVKSAARAALLGRKAWAEALFRAVEKGDVPAKDFGIDELRLVAAHKDAGLNALVRKHWGTVGTGTPEEKLAEVRRFNNDLRAEAGDPVAGKPLFAKHCGTCHKLFGEGGAAGPDLTFANRADRDYLLVSVVDPSAVIRKEYLSYVATLKSGRVVTGLIAEQTADQITFLDAKAEKTTVAREQLDTLQESAVSLMPENPLKELKPRELRDLFAYLQAKAPPKE